MKVFIGWSGDKSRAVAEALAEFLPVVIHAVEPWFSGDIEKGARWVKEVSEQVGASRVGIFCLTRENLDSRWLHFEAGALAQAEDTRACTLLLDLAPSEVSGPLAQFQHTSFKKADVEKLVQTINQAVGRAGEKELTETTLKKGFSAFWPEFASLVEGIAQSEPTTGEIKENFELVDEILEVVRRHGRPAPVVRPEQSRPYARDEAQARLLRQIDNYRALYPAPRARRSDVSGVKARLDDKPES